MGKNCDVEAQHGSVGKCRCECDKRICREILDYSIHDSSRGRRGIDLRDSHGHVEPRVKLFGKDKGRVHCGDCGHMQKLAHSSDLSHEVSRSPSPKSQEPQPEG